MTDADLARWAALLVELHAPGTLRSRAEALVNEMEEAFPLLIAEVRRLRAALQLVEGMAHVGGREMFPPLERDDA